MRIAIGADHAGFHLKEANVLCLGERIIGVELALEMVRVWLATEFSGLERYRCRLAKVAELEGK
jgi:ribose 5-phosphate isomerase B